MSMDDQFQQMNLFYKELLYFNEQLRQSVLNLQELHADVDPLWRDEMRRHYDQHWQVLEEDMKRYLGKDAPRYTEFLAQKLRSLRRYLHGN